MKRYTMLSLLLVAGCGRLFNVGDDTSKRDRLQLADGGWCGQVVCALWCENGFQKGADGCEICACNPVSADPVPCGPSTCTGGEVCCNESCGICTPPGEACTQQWCGPVDAGSRCNPVTCTLACQYGFQKGADGCEICACNPAPDAGAPTACGFNTCATGTECCNPSCGICVPQGGVCTQQLCACAPVTCTLACQYGFKRDADGCEVCACAPPPQACGSVTCAAGLECCNPSCGLCVPPGQACIQTVCP